MPARVRDAMALREGDTLEVELKKGTIVLKPTSPVSVDDLRGIIGRQKVHLEEIEDALGRDVA